MRGREDSGGMAMVVRQEEEEEERGRNRARAGRRDGEGKGAQKIPPSSLIPVLLLFSIEF